MVNTEKRKQPRWILHYNAISATAWFVVLTNTLYFYYIYGQPTLFNLTHKVVIVVQCLALTEIYNSLVGNVRSPLFTTAAQVSSRLLIVLGCFTVIPNAEVNYSFVYVTLCCAWSLTEIIRYSFYAINIETNGNGPRFLTWLRYSTFLVLYPMGISSECWILYKSLDTAENVVGIWYKYFFIFALVVYVPGSYILYSYMLRQRKKIMKNLKSQLDKKTI